MANENHLFKNNIFLDAEDNLTRGTIFGLAATGIAANGLTLLQAQIELGLKTPTILGHRLEKLVAPLLVENRVKEAAFFIGHRAAVGHYLALEGCSPIDEQSFKYARNISFEDF